MRISTHTAYDKGTSAILRENVDLNKTLLQIATGRRILSPADDPADAARVLSLNQEMERTTKYQDNIRAAETSLEIEEKNLQNIVDLMQRVRELTIQASNDTYDADQRKSISYEVRELSDSLLGYANAVNGQGEYLFAGYNIDTVPFVKGAGGDVTYYGDQGQQAVQIGPVRQIATGDSGYEIFMDATDAGGNFPVGSDGSRKISLFRVVDDIEETMRTNNGPASGTETYHAAMQRAISNLDIAIGKVLDVQANIGARQNALESQKNVNADSLVQIQTTMSETQDLDYATAISRLELQQLGLTAAQQSFTQIQGLNLFNYI